MSRLLVGSSSRSSCGAGSASIRAASAARKRSPPDSVAACWSARAPRNRKRASRARIRLLVAPGANRATFSATVRSPSRTSSRCGRNRSGTCAVTSPASGASSPATVRSSVVLPAPLRPISATRSGPRSSNPPLTRAPYRSPRSWRVRTVRPGGTAVNGRSTRISSSSRTASTASSSRSLASASFSSCMIRCLPAETWAARLLSFMTARGSRLVSYIFCAYRLRRASLTWASVSSRFCRRKSASATRTMRSAASCSVSKASS